MNYAQTVQREAEEWREKTERAIEDVRVQLEAMTPQDHVRAATGEFARGNSTEASVHLQFATAKALIREEPPIVGKKPDQPQKVTCRECRGRGKVHGAQTEIFCPTCKGSGTV